MRSNKVYFVAGHSPRKGLFGVVSYLHELEDDEVEFSRFYMARDARWVNQEINEDIVSVSYTKRGDDWSWWLLGKRGDVISLSARGRISESISTAGTGAGKLGYLDQIREIDGQLYACGLRRQVYVRDDSGWSALSSGALAAERKYGFRAIDGSSSSDIHAVGYVGEIWYFDGDVWRQANSPTNVTLEAIRYVGPEMCYACGKSGIVVRGYKDKWEIVDYAGKQNFWGVEVFQGKVYLSSTSGLYIVDQNGIQLLNLGRKVEGRRLYSNGSELWSMENHELWVYDGASWQEVVCPDNA